MSTSRRSAVVVRPPSRNGWNAIASSSAYAAARVRERIRTRRCCARQGSPRDIGENRWMSVIVGEFSGVLRRDVVLATPGERLVDNVGKNARFGPGSMSRAVRKFSRTAYTSSFFADSGGCHHRRRGLPAAFHGSQRIQLCVATHGDRLRVQRVGDTFESADRIDHHEHRVLLAFHHPEGGA